jgi:type IV pilus assembly protein PilC
MTQFVCHLAGPDGAARTEVFTAPDAGALKKSLQEKGYYILSIRKKGLLSSDVLFRKREKITTETFMIFNQELAALLKAGLPLLGSLEVLAERQQDRLLQRILLEIIAKIKGGESLSDAFASYGDLFPKLYATTLKSGERTGELEVVIRRFIQYQKVILAVKRKVRGAMVYPAVLFGLSITLIIIMITVVIPKFTSFYADMDADLPFLTQVVLAVSDFAVSNGPYLLLGAVAGVTFLTSWIKTPAGRRSVDGMLLHVPLLGPILHLFSITQFTRSMGTLVGGGTPAVQALEISAGTISNTEISASIQGVVHRVQEGESLWNSLESTGKLPSVAVEMIKVGESTGALEDMLFAASEFFDEEINTKLGRLMTLIEPLILVFMGGLVATLLASVYLPLIQLVGKLK